MNAQSMLRNELLITLVNGAAPFLPNNLGNAEQIGKAINTLLDIVAPKDIK